ncbi:MAG: ankyrin repeat domain-containing protein [Spirochaetota bacterium]
MKRFFLIFFLSILVYPNIVISQQKAKKAKKLSKSEQLKLAKQELWKSAREGNPAGLAAALQKGAKAEMRDSTGKPALILIAQYAPVDKIQASVKVLLEKGANANIVDKFGYTGLHYAVKQGDEPKTTILLDSGLNINAKDRRGRTPFLSVVLSAGMLQVPSMAKLLVGKGADVNVRDLDIRSPLHYAAKSGNLALVQFLIKNKAVVDAKDIYDRTSLHEAASQGYAKIVSILLKYKADKNAKDINSKTPLLLAAEYAPTGDGLKTMLVFLKARAKLNESDRNGISVLHALTLRSNTQGIALMKKSKGNFNLKDKEGKTPLFYAVERLDKSDTVKVTAALLRGGAKPKVFDAEKKTPLHIATARDIVPLVKLLLQKGSKANTLDVFGQNPLFLVKSEAVTKLLLGKGANAKQKDKDKLTPLHFAPNGKIALLLLKKRANPRAQDVSLVTPLHFACIHGREDVLFLLLKYKAKVNVMDVDGRTPLHEAAKFGHEKIVASLLQRKARVNIADSDGATPMHEAVSFSHSKIVGLLLKKKPNLKTRDDYGRTPIDIAKRIGDKKVLALFP